MATILDHSMCSAMRDKRKKVSVFEDFIVHHSS